LKKLNKHNIHSIRTRALALLIERPSYTSDDPQTNLAAIYTQAVLDELEYEKLLKDVIIAQKDPYDGPNS